MLFPVIAWYDIIIVRFLLMMTLLLFPVIAWYDIIAGEADREYGRLLFPVIAWYDIILKPEGWRCTRCCSQLSLGMI